MENHEHQKKANFILISCVLFNLSVGVLYSWSVFKDRLMAVAANGGWEWQSSQAGLPYSIAIVSFALGLLIGGRVQDKIGPRWVLTAGGALTGIGMILSGLVGNSVMGITICFGVITGLGIGFGYGSATPPALKWFHPSKKGLVSGLIVGGFGIAPVYLAPLTNILLNNFAISRTMIILGVTSLVISTTVAQFIRNPPAGYVPSESKHAKKSAKKSSSEPDSTWREMVRTKSFYFLFVMFLLSSSVGLMIIGNITKIAREQIGITDTAILALLVSFLAITNTSGRVIGGIMSDKIGRVNGLLIVFILQSINMVAFVYYPNLALLIIGIILVGFSYGTLLSVFPSLTADLYGLKNYGTNYGILYLAWGLAGVVAPMLADYFYYRDNDFFTAYKLCAGMMVLIIGIDFVLKRDLLITRKKSF